ncbi:hypothetical protein COCNU_scaffold018677G000020 [Cocos nucifera]|nr:hypothetical protein [Cocos nucifera]
MGYNLQLSTDTPFESYRRILYILSFASDSSQGIRKLWGWRTVEISLRYEANLGKSLRLAQKEQRMGQSINEYNNRANRSHVL